MRVLKRLQLAGLQKGSFAMGDAWLFFLNICVTDTSRDPERGGVVVLWTRLHGEMSSILLQGYRRGEGTSCFANR